jgi:hypothetical protein
VTAAVVASNERQLREVAAAARDLWFRPEDVVYDARARRVTIALTGGEQRRGWFGWKYFVRGEARAGMLTFEDVLDCRVVDEAEIGDYLVNHFVVEPTKEGVRIRLVANAPLTVEMMAARIAVRFDPPG